jgi:hypothetical protein
LTVPAFDADTWPDFVGRGVCTDYARFRVFRTYRSPWETAGDQRAQAGGANLLYAYRLGWRNLTPLQAAALSHAQEFAGGEGDGLYFYEWKNEPTPAPVVLGVAPGGGVVASFDLQAVLLNNDPFASGLQLFSNSSPIGFLGGIAIVAGANYTFNLVSIAAADNIAGRTITATWTKARRRRRLALDGGPLQITTMPGGVGNRLQAAGNFIETVHSE